MPISAENSIRQSLGKMQNKKLEPIKWIYDKCHIPDFSYAENGGLNLVVYLA